MKRNITIVSVALCVMLGIALFSPLTRGYTYDTIEKLLNRIVEQSVDQNSIRVEFANTVGEFSVHSETALTNTVDPSLEVRHTTTGTPANGIGTSLDFKQETAAGNEEIIARIAAVTTDVTATSEDAKIDFMTMAAGATAATKLSIGSTGLLTLAGSATIDNATSATNLAIAETNIGLTGILTITGATTITGDSVLDGGLIVNESSADKDVRIETNDVSDAIVVDGGANFISNGTWVKYDYITTTAESYSLTSTGRASNIIQTVSGQDGTLHLMTALLTSPGAGAVITIKTGNTQTVTIDTEGAETIDGANTYALDGNYEAVTLTNDGSNWFILGGYLE